MITNPYTLLGIAPDNDDDTIRKRYLDLVREFPPEHAPEKFAAIRSAYEQVRDLDRRVRYRLFEQGKSESLEAIIEELECNSPRPRMTLRGLLSNLNQKQ